MKTDSEIIHLTKNKVREFSKHLDRDVYFHLLWMLNMIEGDFTHINDIRKINRWLGFIHGTLVALTDCTVDELRDMIRDEV